MNFLSNIHVDPFNFIIFLLIIFMIIVQRLATL